MIKRGFIWRKKTKVVMITGATSGFGKATAHYLAANGYKVYGFCKGE